MSQHNQYPPQREAIVDKLHGALATFRRERDEVHRAKELAFERLRLAREERMAADRNLQSMKDKYDKMMQSMSKSDGNNNEVAKLQTEVERLSREARFQHGELVSKRDKMNQLQSSMEEEKNNRSGYLRLAREAVRKRREKAAIREAKEDSDNRNENENIEMIKKLLQSSGDEQDLYPKLQRLIEKNVADVADEIESIGEKSNALTKRIAGYVQFMNGEEGNTDNKMEGFGMKQ